MERAQPHMLSMLIVPPPTGHCVGTAEAWDRLPLTSAAGEVICVFGCSDFTRQLTLARAAPTLFHTETPQPTASCGGPWSAGLVGVTDKTPVTGFWPEASL